MTAPVVPAPAAVPLWIARAREVSEALIQSLIAGRRDLGGVSVDLDALRSEADRILDAHAETLASLSVGALFDLFGASGTLAPADGKAWRTAYAAALAGLDAEGLALEAEATADAVEEVRAIHARRVALFRDLAAASRVVVQGVVGAALAGALAGL